MTSKVQRILLVEDEPGLVLTLTDRLEGEGYQVESRGDGESGLEAALEGGYDLLILDWMLPRKSGLDVCRRLRQADIDTPILMLTARGEIVDKVVGLQTGADDYLTKPFDMMELLARIQALLRRAPRSGNNAAPAATFQFGTVTVNFKNAEVSRAGKPVALSAREYHLLRYLIEHRGSLVSREQLLSDVWGYEDEQDSPYLRVHMAAIRRKLEPDTSRPRYFVTEPGMGYRFEG